MDNRPIILQSPLGPSRGTKLPWPRAGGAHVQPRAQHRPPTTAVADEMAARNRQQTKADRAAVVELISDTPSDILSETGVCTRAHAI